MKKVTRQTRTSYEVNGVKYARLEDVPPEFRKLLEDADNDGIPDIVQAFGSSTPRESDAGSDLIDLLAPTGDGEPGSASARSPGTPSAKDDTPSVRSVKATVTRTITTGADLTPAMRELIATTLLEGDDARRQREAEICCLECGYDLTGSTIGRKCPECGHPVSSSIRALMQPKPMASEKVVERVFGTRGVLVAIVLAALSILVLWAMLI